MSAARWAWPKYWSRDVKNIRELHLDMGLAVLEVMSASGRAHAHLFIAAGTLVRVVTWWQWMVAVLFGVRGVIILARGTGRSKPPVVLLDWETYSRIVIGLRPEMLKSLGIDAGSEEAMKREHDDARAETGGAF